MNVNLYVTSKALVIPFGAKEKSLEQVLSVCWLSKEEEVGGGRKISNPLPLFALPPQPLLVSFHIGLKLSFARPTTTVNKQRSSLQALFSSLLAHSCIACEAGGFCVYFLFCFAVSYSRVKAEPNRNCGGEGEGSIPSPIIFCFDLISAFTQL